MRNRTSIPTSAWVILGIILPFLIAAIVAGGCGSEDGPSGDSETTQPTLNIDAEVSYQHLSDQDGFGVAEVYSFCDGSNRKLKGDSAEREAAHLIAELTGHPARRKLGAGRADDTGDIDGVPATVVQVANWGDVARAVREKPTGAEIQQWATYHRETL